MLWTRLPVSENLKVAIKPSHIHGLGLFAAQDFRAGDVIGIYEGPVVKHVGDHVLWVYDEDDREYGIDGQTETRYVNHSSRPNACFFGEVLEALRPIRRGEEITHDYGEAWEDLD
ncbi:MAG: SET domain-containing protein-lysine N-methyltransferase [Planctomycetes bacterium]|nr:SET domain-containing protein-lysine N-methyltransferase [Planctomycetota bacterium]